jgi:hypothetical protein
MFYDILKDAVVERAMAAASASNAAAARLASSAASAASAMSASARSAASIVAATAHGNEAHVNTMAVVLLIILTILAAVMIERFVWKSPSFLDALLSPLVNRMVLDTSSHAHYHISSPDANKKPIPLD